MNKSYFETIKIIDSKPLHMPYHQKRYESVLTSLGIKEFENLEDYIKAPEIGLYKCRLVYTPHAISVTYDAYKKREISFLKLIFNNDIEYATKSTSRRELDALYAKKDECDDVLIIKNLLVTDTSIANIAFYKNGIWITPKQPLLEGTTRSRLLDEGKIVEADIKVRELRTFSKVALLNAMIDFDILDRCEFLI